MTLSPHDLRGQLLGGRYRIGSVLGRGGMGTVYEAVQESLGRRVAVKVLHPALSSDADAVARFRNEAEQAGALSHPHIVHVLDFGHEQGGLAWLAMERLEGESLGQRLGRSRALPQRAVVPIALETLSALQAAHELGKLVHRDLKPDNIFLARAAGVGEVVKVLDFGIAKLLDGGAAAALTATGMVVGTPLYMSPEQAQGKTVDARADLYSLGAVLYEALAGRTPFRADSYTALLITIVTQAAPPLARSGVDVDLRLAAIVDRALSKDPAQRFASAGEMADAIRSLGIDTQGRSAVASDAAGPSLALAETVQGSATPPAAPSPVAPADTQPVAGAPSARGPLVRLRWPKTAGIGTILVAVVAVFSWVGLRQGSRGDLVPQLETGDAVRAVGARRPMAFGEGGTDVRAAAATPPGPPTPPARTPMTPLEVPIEEGRGEDPPPGPPRPGNPGSPGTPTKAASRPGHRAAPPPGLGVRISPTYFAPGKVPNVRSTFTSRSDWSACWPAQIAPPEVNRGRCLLITVSGSGELTRVVIPPSNQEPSSFMQCLVQRTRTLTFEAPTTGEESTLQVCFSIDAPLR